MASRLSELEALYHLAYNVFLPLRLPQSELDEGSNQRVNLEIAQSLVDSIHQYRKMDTNNTAQWNCMARMAQRIASHIEIPLSKGRLSLDMANMQVNDVLPLYIRAQNASVIIRKGHESTIFSIFEVQVPAEEVMSKPGKLVLSYPGPAVKIPNTIADDAGFIAEIASFLAQTDTEVFREAVPTTRKARSTVREVRDVANPNYFTQLFLGILRGMGPIIDPPKVVKRIADEVLWHNAYRPWRRSPIWLIIRVALQTSLDSTLSYKQFMAFHHAKIISRCLNHEDFSSELLFMMRAKMARRLLKLQNSAPNFVTEAGRAAAEGAQEVLQRRWTSMQAEHARSPEWDPSAFDFEAATHQTLPNSRVYLEQVFKGLPNQKPPSTFTPKNAPRLENIKDFTIYADGVLAKTFSTHKHIALFDFEISVFEHLSTWVDRNISNAEIACKTVHSCFQQYLDAASSCYMVDVADRSIMILTLMRLWVAIDQLATSACGLLLDFSPEIPADLLDQLLLHTSQHLEQARLTQLYIIDRHDMALSSNSSIFSNCMDSSCFAVQYFRESTNLQTLKSKIELSAKEEQKAKIKELHKKNEEYCQLIERVEGMEHDFVQIDADDPDLKKHAPWCKRCAVERSSRDMRISPYEWPLPINQSEAEAIVFELRRPGAFMIWRDVTYRVLRDLASVSDDARSFSIKGTLESYDGLRAWRTTSNIITARVVLASSTKSFNRSHYSKISIPATEDSVCLNNGLQFKLFDRDQHIEASGPFNELSYAQYGTLELPSRSLYEHLKYALTGTTHTSNQVLADQFHCPKNLSLHEHIAFGTLRSGPRLQWMNIIRGLAENILTFSREEIYRLHTQAAWQIGPLSDDLSSREWHIDLEEPTFRTLLITQCFSVLERVRGNWLEATTLSIIVLLVTRLLASSHSDGTENAYKLLREVRRVSVQWLSELQVKLQEAKTKSNIIDYQYRICELAVTCRSTFDVDSVYLANVLCTPEDFAALINCSIILHDNQPADAHAGPTNFRQLLCRERRLAHKVVPYVLRALSRDCHILCKPISLLWPGYQSSPQGWKSLMSPNDNWVSTVTAGLDGHVSQKVHFNLMDGQLLIDGKPLGRLPREYFQHPTYIRLFGERVLNVVPASIQGMEFATRDCVYDHHVFFSYNKVSKQLVIQARKNGQTYQLVPHSQLANDLPEFLTLDYHHWAHLESSIIQFRPLSHPWSRSHHQWLIRFIHNGATTIENTASGSVLIDIHSHLFGSLSRQLAPLELSRYLHATWSPDSQIQIELPRMKLLFFINKDMQLESHNFRGQIIDENQSAGTMIGLKNQLVLRPKDLAVQLPRSRSVLVPHGDVEVTSHRHHVLVTVQLGSDRHVPLHQYQVDSDLGYLTSNSGLTSRLFKIYLHALTSHCLPDTLTGRTGTEEALHELSEPATSSFEQIDKEQANLLKSIGSLTPKREYYPAHLKRMQKTHWGELPTLSQHFAFSTVSAPILRRADTLRLFFPLEFELSDCIISTEKSLLKRAARQAVTFYPGGTTNYVGDPEGEATLHDQDCSASSERLTEGWERESQSAAWASCLVLRSWGQAVYTPYDLVSQAESWGSLEGPSTDMALTFSSQWLDLNLSAAWITIYNLCRQALVSQEVYGLCTCLATAIFSQKLPLKMLPVLVAFATNPAFRHLNPPRHPSFRLEDGYEPDCARIQKIVSSCSRGLRSTPASNLSQHEDETRYQFQRRQQQEYKQKISKYESSLIPYFLNQWPSTRVEVPSASYSSWFELQSCVKRVEAYFSSCARNTQLRDHFLGVEHILSSRSASPELQITGTPFPKSLDKQQVDVRTPRGPSRTFCLDYLMGSRASPNSEDFILLSRVAVSRYPCARVETSRLSELFAEFQTSTHPLNCRYGYELDISRKDLDSKPALTRPNQLPPAQLFIQNKALCESYLEAIFLKIKAALGPLTPIDQIASISGVWPRLTPRIILGCLSLNARSKHNSSPEWRNMFTGYARAFVEYQRSQRLVALAESRNTEELLKELDLENGSDSSADMCDPDWLLVQIDGNFRARAVQRQVAQEMILPSSGGNTTLQLNMGEGKSSVIVPIIAASLANAQQLVRVVVLKPLWRQMLHLLVSRLSGLAHRRIYYLPFSRNIRMNSSEAQQLQELYDECMREGGILLAQPEHILSFKLMGIDRLMSSSEREKTTAIQLRNMQKWLTENTRDILDESDEILHVRYQLVYTVGSQHPLENHPDRWGITQQLLWLAATRIFELKSKYPDSLRCETKGGGEYPPTRIMPDCDEGVQRQLITSIAEDVLGGRLLSLNFSRLAPSTRQLAFQFLTKKEIPYPAYQTLQRECDHVIWKGLLLVRGLLALGVLVFALKNKHYRVDYGLDLKRSLLAVPFRAKDVPSLRAEFGHPDVAVVLTCLSYYYKGLTDDQLDHCFELLYKLDNPSLEYEQWVRRNDATPVDLLHLNGINTKDREQFKNRIIPTFSRNSATVDFFLSAVVFPKAAKEFPQKLCTSGWDLAEQKPHVTTGFSGTNDNRYLLPTSITQSDPVKQLSTNALVLTYLLQPENNSYMCMRAENGGSLTSEKFLRRLVDQQPEIRVLLDVGAQMLELENEDLVRCWLNLRPDVEAAVYFNDKDELVVLPQNGEPSPLYSSPFAQQLDKCIVYLDDGHTRGTDLKLPTRTRALVTLGPKVTKDRLLQGCMRMRKLGYGQSVMFAAPPEIDRQIRKSAPNPLNLEEHVDALDILRWAMLETCKDLQHHVPHWAQQGIDYYRRAEAEKKYATRKNIMALKEGWVVPESRSLEDMYGVTDASSSSRAILRQVFDMPNFRDRLGILGIKTLEDPRIDEEQEREVSHEVERQQQVEQPPKEQAVKHALHPDVLHFIENGSIPAQSSGIISLFSPLDGHRSSETSPWSNRVFASVDFSRTVAKSSVDSIGDYMRPVNWIVRGSGGTRVVLSPFEVNQLLPTIRRSKTVQLHVYAPRVTHFMKSFSDLQFYSIPAQSSIPRSSALSRNQMQLDLFAGQLYLSSYEQYLLLCTILGVYTATQGRDSLHEIQTASDGFVSPMNRSQLVEHHPHYARCRFAASPIPILKDLIGRRRRGMEYMRTHVGQVLYARSLTPNDF